MNVAMNLGLPSLCFTLATALLGSLGVGMGIDVATARQEGMTSTDPMAFADARRNDVTKAHATPPLPALYRRQADGLFYIHARVNGARIRFVIDTGASVTVLSRRDAARAGIVARPHGRGELRTAGGSSGMSWATIDRLSIGGRQIGGLDAALADADMPTSLLGQDVLGQLGSLTLQGDVLTIE